MKTKPDKVLVIGWDGADWKVASPLVDAGKMPNLQRLIEKGVMGNISTLYPVLSPMLWTSIATGKRAHKHGIHGFAEPDLRNGSVRPVTNLGRKCKAVWNILNQYGKKCNVVGWWPSHPAEPINGVMVSNHFQTATTQTPEKWPLRPGTIHPAKLSRQLCKFRVHPFEIQSEQLLPFVPEAAKIDQEKDQRLFSVAKMLAEVSSTHAVATAIMQHEPWEFMGVYYDAIDHFSHGFMKYHPPRESWISEDDFELYKHVVEAAYRFHDMMLGALIALAGSETTIILLSDHGFHPDHLRPRSISNEPAGPADEHRHFGMLVLNGPGIKQDGLVFGASLLDITPTILTLFDLPIGRDMDGRPLIDAMTRKPPEEYIDSWETVEGEDGRHPSDTQVDPVDAHESLKQLIELGYVEELDEDKEKTARNTVRELRYNLARDLMDSNHLPEAIRELTQLWHEFPDESRFGVKLFVALLSLGDVERAEATLQKIVIEKKRYAEESAKELGQLKDEFEDVKAEDMTKEDIRKIVQLRRRATTNPDAFTFLRGSLMHAKGEFEQSLELLQKSEGVQTYNLPSVLQKKGECYIGLGKWAEARGQFQQILKIEPANASAYFGIAQCELASNRPKLALAATRSAIGLIYHNPKAHYLAARAQLQLGHRAKAIASLQIAITQNTVFPDAHKFLARIHRKNGDAQLGEQHEALAEKARHRIENFKKGLPLPVDADLQLDIVLDQSIGIGEFGDTDAPFDLNKTVVVVSGLPRSGTSMMMQVLAAGGLQPVCDNIRSADESNPRGYFEYEPVKALGQNGEWVKDAKGKAIKIIAQLLPSLPRDLNYRVIFMARPLKEILASQTKMLQRLNRSGASISDRQLAATYKKHVEFVAQVATNYPNLTAITVDFAEAVANPKQLASKVNSLLGGQLDELAMALAIDPSLRNEQMDAAEMTNDEQ